MAQTLDKLTVAQLKRLALVETLHAGAGKNGLEDACLMQAVDWVYRNKDHFTDSPECASPTLTSFGIRLNDARWPTDEDRTDALRPAIPLLIGTRTADKDIELRRRYRLVDFAVREAAPYWFDYAYKKTKKKVYGDHAAKMRGVAPVTSAATSKAARVVAADADAAYAAAAAAAAAAADAADAAHAAAAHAADAADAAAAADAAYAAHAAAAHAAYAADAADADAADAARLVILRRAAEVLIEACQIR